MLTGKTQSGTLNSLKNILLLNLMLSSWLWNSKRLFQGSMNLEDFQTKALRLAKEAEYPEGAAHGIGY